MNYEIDVLDQGTVWQGGAVDAAIDSPPFAGPLLVVCMDRGEDNDQFINHASARWPDRSGGTAIGRETTGPRSSRGGSRACSIKTRATPVEDAQ
jgi:hypothetical protein